MLCVVKVSNPGELQHCIRLKSRSLPQPSRKLWTAGGRQRALGVGRSILQLQGALAPSLAAITQLHGKTLPKEPLPSTWKAFVFPLLVSAGPQQACPPCSQIQTGYLEFLHLPLPRPGHQNCSRPLLSSHCPYHRYTSTKVTAPQTIVIKSEHFK